MLKKILVGAGCVGLIGVGLVALLVVLMTKDLWFHPDLWFKRLGRRTRLELDGLARVAVPPTFRLEGLVNSGRLAYFNGDTVPPAHHFDDRKATWRFVQAQHNDIGGHPTFPAILDVTVLGSAVPAAELLPVTATTVGRFYSNMESTPPFSDLEWTRIETKDGAETRALAHRDVYTAGEPGRWLVIHVDPRRRVRVDLYVWKSAYRLNEAWRLAQSVAAGLEALPALDTHLADAAARRATEEAAYARELEARFGAGPDSGAPADTAPPGGGAH